MMMMREERKRSSHCYVNAVAHSKHTRIFATTVLHQASSIRSKNSKRSWWVESRENRARHQASRPVQRVWVWDRTE